MCLIENKEKSRLSCFKLNGSVTFIDNNRYSLRQKIGTLLYSMLTRGGKSIGEITKIEKRHQALLERFKLNYSQEGCMQPTNILKGMAVMGYFQSEKCFSSVSEIIKDEFEFLPEITEACIPTTNEIISSESCCIHIRRGDYLKSPVFGVCTDKYYVEAINKIKEMIPNVRFYVFSDDIDSVKDVFGEVLSEETTYIPSSYSDQESMCLGSKCKHFIISNSTFSWWMQYLSSYENKIVIAPSRWYNDGRECYIYQNNWILVEP